MLSASVFLRFSLHFCPNLDHEIINVTFDNLNYMIKCTKIDTEVYIYLARHIQWLPPPTSGVILVFNPSFNTPLSMTNLLHPHWLESYVKGDSYRCCLALICMIKPASAQPYQQFHKFNLLRVETTERESQQN